MKFGFIGTEGGHFYQEFMDEVIRAEELGFDSAWLEEHHGVKDHYWPSPMMCLAGVATRTSQIVLGTDIIVLPFYHPVRVAEDAATLDVMSGGRFILGAAIGYRPDEFALYQAPLKMRGARYVEALTLIRRLWTEDTVSYSGKYYQVEDARIEPRPDQALPIWLGGWGDLSLERAATLGDAWVPGPTADLEKLLDCQDTYREHLIAGGAEIEAVPTPLTREVVIAETDSQALELAERHLLVNYRDEYGGGWQHPLIGSTDSTDVNRIDTLSRDRFIIGSPETCIRQIQRFVDTFGMDHLICRLYFPGMSHTHIMTELELLANEVMPAFKE
ncbi:MAG: LLM class flavin-dependent oxidoreductase [SAR202 cluster bacterium]|nr:LLM class flavin-dependent oxidoreductase [SAR202 cluster bacterium]MDP6512110.1 LLM class flavin-dependent oxidoreductase [SAR202 cluster bacterium]MDP6714420.1 LLM class flavin-dependent oxidoreductase [SAR202 cluster bacterium]